MKYIRKFEYVSDYADAITGGELSYPNMSYISEDDSVRYVKTAPVEQDYLEFDVLDDNFTFQFTSGLSYSTNQIAWTSLAANTPSPAFNSGDTIYLMATNTPTPSVGSGTFSTTGRFIAKGYPASMVYGGEFMEHLTTVPEAAFANMFSGCTGLTDASEIQLPATTLSTACYYQMFYGCTSITSAPELPATTLEYVCYYGMFEYCASLSAVTCLATDISANYSTTNWLHDVAATGTFTKDSSMNDWTTGGHGIPDGWTVQDYTG